MAIITYKPLHAGRPGTDEQKWISNLEAAWRVVTDSYTDTRTVIASDSRTPRMYQPHPDNPNALLINLSITPEGDESGLVWEVRGQYSTSYDFPYPRNPLERPARWSGSLAHFTRPALVDINGNAILNMAGDPYDPPLEADDSRQSFQAVRNEASPPWSFSQTYKDAINSDSWNGAPPRTVKIFDISFGELQYENGYAFYPVTYSFQHNAENWLMKPLEIGYNGAKQTSGTWKKVPFGGDSEKLLKRISSTLISFTDNPAEATFTSWRYYKELPFAFLGLIIPT
jgi:hypothetical protein